MKAILFLGATGLAYLAVAQQAPLRARIIYIHEGDVNTIHCRALMDCSIEAPKGEKFIAANLGDPERWPDSKGSLPSRFYSIKPAFAGMRTTLHLVTDHDNEYGFVIEESVKTDPDYTVILKSDDAEINARISGPSTVVPRAELTQAEKERDAALAALQQAKADSEAKLRETQKNVAAEMRSYTFDRKKASERPWNISDIQAGDHSTYIKRSVKADDLPSVYGIGQNGKPELVVPHYDPDRDVYVISQRLVDGYLSFGGQKKEKKLTFHLPEGV